MVGPNAGLEKLQVEVMGSVMQARFFLELMLYETIVRFGAERGIAIEQLPLYFRFERSPLITIVDYKLEVSEVVFLVDVSNPDVCFAFEGVGWHQVSREEMERVIKDRKYPSMNRFECGWW